jgi:hypothetical protein
MNFELRFSESDIAFWASRYEIETDYLIEREIVPRTKRAKFLSREDFLSTCAWKTPRSKKHCARNTEEEIREITNIALTASSEKVRLEILRLLHGVEYPTASVILHWCHQDPYPIIDFRAAWSLSVAEEYTMSFWMEYTVFCRHLAIRNHVSMRNLDRALWQYSKENQS